MGAMQSVGGAMMRVAWIALWIFSASSRWMSPGRRLGDTPAVSQMVAEVLDDTRLKSPERHERTLRALVSRNICISTPSSTP
jgi:hypothetical protein